MLSDECKKKTKKTIVQALERDTAIPFYFLMFLNLTWLTSNIFLSKMRCGKLVERQYDLR